MRTRMPPNSRVRKYAVPVVPGFSMRGRDDQSGVPKGMSCICTGSSYTPRMKSIVIAMVVLLTGVVSAQRTGPMRFTEPDPLDFNDHEGYVSIFDGKTLKDWDG